MESVEAELRRARTQTRLYRTLAAVSHAVMRADTIEEVYAGLCRAAVKEGGFLFSWVGVPDCAGVLRPVFMEGVETVRLYLETVKISVDAALPTGRGPSGVAWREGRTVVVHDLGCDPRAAPWRETSKRIGLRSALSVPIRPGGMSVAVFVLYSAEPDFFTPEIVELAERVAREVEYALDNLVLAQKVSSMSAALHESRTMLSRMINTLPSACYVLDVRTQKLIFASAGIERVTGLSPSEMLGLGPGLCDAAHPDDLVSNDVAARHAALRDGEVMEWEGRMRAPDGMWRRHRLRESVFERDADGRVRLVIGSVEDISAFSALTFESRRVASAVEAAAESVVITDAKGVIVYVNPAFTRITGYAREEAVGKHTRVLRSGKHDDDFYKALWTTVSAGRVWHGHLVNRRKDGTLFEEDASISPVLDDHGRVVNFVAVKRDVSKELELERQLLQSQKLEAIGRLAGGVAHDFNNILTAILGCTELVTAQVPAGSALRADLDEIRRSGLRAADLTRQLLIYSRRQVIMPRLLDPVRSLGAFQKMLLRIVGEDVRLKFVHVTRGTCILADPGQLEQVVMNFVVNARDASPPGGEIEVAVRDVSLPEAVDGVEDPVPAGEYVVFSVRDAGAGIPPEILPHIFEPFFTTKASGVGTGLGLSTVYGIVKQAGAYLAVDTAAGRGTTMFVYWPAAVGQEPSDDGGSGAARGGTERVLLVEDEVAVCRLVERELKGAGYRVTSARDAKAALPLAASQEFDLLLTDVILTRGVNGRELATELVRVHPELKVLYMSGYTGETIAHSGVLDVATRLLQKPFTQNALLRAVRDALDARP